MNKDDYIRRNFSKIKHKPWELYVVTRMIHMLNDPDIEFVCQQLVRRPDGSRALTDLFFPQFRWHLEVDEGYHGAAEVRQLDRNRARDIIDATGHSVKRLQVFDGNVAKTDRSLLEVNDEISELVTQLLDMKKKQLADGQFEAWNMDRRYGHEQHLEAGLLRVSDNPAFRTHREAMRCFGYTGGNYQRSMWRIPDTDLMVWFPKLYENGGWDNQLTRGGLEIVEKQIVNPRPIVDRLSDEWNIKRVTFAHGKDNLGRVLYRFVGVFKPSKARSSDVEGAIYDRVADTLVLPPN